MCVLGDPYSFSSSLPEILAIDAQISEIPLEGEDGFHLSEGPQHLGCLLYVVEALYYWCTDSDHSFSGGYCTQLHDDDRLDGLCSGSDTLRSDCLADLVRWLRCPFSFAKRSEILQRLLLITPMDWVMVRLMGLVQPMSMGQALRRSIVCI